LPIFHSNLTQGRRKAAGVRYPNAYASAKEAEDNQAKLVFNAAQRAHANFSDAYPAFLITLLISGLKFPTISAGMGIVWIAGRVAYALGYARKDQTVQDGGKGRYAGAWWYVPHFALGGLSIYTGVTMVM